MNQTSPTHKNSSSTSSARNKKPRRRVPPVWMILFCLVIVVALVLLHRFSVQLHDRFPWYMEAFTSLFTILGVLIIALTLLIWFLFRSSYSFLQRWTAGAAMVALVVAFFACWELTLDGDLRPVNLRWRWAQKPDERLAIPTLAASTAGPTVASNQDFSQFLGPYRNGMVDWLMLNRDWDEHAPELIWNQKIGAGWSGFAAANGFAVTLEQRGKSELVTCYNIETGDLVWLHSEEARHEAPLGGIGPRSTPTLHQGKVYTVGATGIVLCLDGKTGSQIWRAELVPQTTAGIKADMEGVMWGRSGSPLIYEDLVIVPCGGVEPESRASLVAFNLSDGKEVWRGGQEQIGYSSPILVSIGDQQQIVTVNESSVAGHDPKTGEQQWIYSRPGNSTGDANTSQPLVVSNQRLLLTKGYGLGAELIELKRSEDGKIDPTRLWQQNRLLKTKYTSAVQRGGYAFGLSDGILECIDIEQGKRQWKRGRYGHGQVLLVGDSLLVLTEKGELVLVDASPNQHEELGRIDALDGITWNTLCIYRDKLLVRNGEEVACFRLPVQSWLSEHQVRADR